MKRRLALYGRIKLILFFNCMNCYASFGQVTLPRDTHFPLMLPEKSSYSYVYGIELLKVVVGLNKINLDSISKRINSVKVYLNDSLIVNYNAVDLRRNLMIMDYVYNNRLYKDSTYNEKKHEWLYYTAVAGRRSLSQKKIFSNKNLLCKVESFDFDENLIEQVLFTYKKNKRLTRERLYSIEDRNRKLRYDLHYQFHNKNISEIAIRYRTDKFTKIFNQRYSDIGLLIETHHEVLDENQKQTLLEEGRFLYDKNSKFIELIELRKNNFYDVWKFKYLKNQIFLTRGIGEIEKVVIEMSGRYNGGY
jgi:hypothetical protein